MTTTLTPELLLSAYATGVFPMAEHRDDDDVFWVDPRQRGVLPLDAFHISRSLRKTIRSNRFHVSFDTDFEGVVAGCADREETWINDMLTDLYGQLHRGGVAHSVEVWDGEALVGGVFGIALGGAFFGESMFSTRTDASKLALAYLVDRLRVGGFSLFDTQFITPHLASLGGLEIPRPAYRQKLSAALENDAAFDRQGDVTDAYSLLQRNAQTS
ncbi:leucyl/phenylalanyl-tRNA--protein transferase [Octadecabacter sp. 1_MG-2023]|uniref:leucyl/phenylalanyl-tRNA--protein transferase n=1 Tax=unclassified Octadecabacter TaxID=196158 RepID=UPI001C09CB09|nr:MULTISPECIES: leucyl/phenylalanyl-tRNA--protein transferase [unclassified Octadecabacter]MBU2992991.1 leucyl/phenylalanyl-tRNA--protein transferase [Octadecabacter sp. B2R22]MDO6733557.1 leucyl/phenylalanyl-tRNA--protein transferase [Octadecabacter sp. 1_MG-2023]